jgi:hypothetical protein
LGGWSRVKRKREIDTKIASDLKAILGIEIPGWQQREGNE